MRNGYTLRVFNQLEQLSARWRIKLVAPPPAKDTDNFSAEIAEYIPVDLQGPGVSLSWRFDPAGLRAAVNAAVLKHSPDRALVWCGAERIWLDFARPSAGRLRLDRLCATLFLAFACGQTESAHPYEQPERAGYLLSVCAPRCTAVLKRHLCGRDRRAMAALDRWSPLRRSRSKRGFTSGPRSRRATEDSVPDRLRLSFTGTLNFGPNVDAIEFLVREIWPLVRSVYPDAELLIAGRNPTPAVIAYDGRSGVVVRANVPNVFSLLRQSQVSIAPMRFGSGVKNKVLEAWASGIPVVLTPLAVNGLTMPRGHERLIHSTARDLAQAVIDMFSNSSQARHLGANARQHVREHYTWRLWADRIDQLLRDAAPDHLHRRVFENPERRARAMPASTAVRSPRL